MRILVIGDPDTVLGFSLVGMSGQVAHTPGEVLQALEAAADDPEIGVILITEAAAALAPERVDALRVARSGPILVEIPGPEGPQTKSPLMRDLIARATGVRL